MHPSPGRLIKIIRLVDLDVTQRQLAADLGIDPNTLSLWERDRFPATWKYLAAILSRTAPERREQLIRAILDYEPDKPDKS